MWFSLCRHCSCVTRPLCGCLIRVVKCQLPPCFNTLEQSRVVVFFPPQSHLVTCFSIKDNAATALKLNVCCLQLSRSILQHHYRINLCHCCQWPHKNCSSRAKWPTCAIFFKADVGILFLKFILFFSQHKLLKISAVIYRFVKAHVLSATPPKKSLIGANKMDEPCIALMLSKCIFCQEKYR